MLSKKIKLTEEEQAVIEEQLMIMKKEKERSLVKNDFSNMPSISLLLGAGFSVPKGYPAGKKLNKQILACDGTEFTFHTDGSIISTYPDAMYRNTHEIRFDFVRQLIRFYNDNIKPKPFDYEEFYDYLLEAIYNDKLVEEGKDFLGIKYKRVKELLNDSDSIYTQIVDYYLKDRDGKRYHDDEGHTCKPIMPGYTGILNCFEQWGKEGVVHIHTLNHDLWLERLAVSDWMQEGLSDGFDEIGSSYFGKLTCHNRSYMVRLSRYNGKYDKKFRFYKLHGSRDYVCYSTSKKHVSDEELIKPFKDLLQYYGLENHDDFKIPVAYLKSIYGIGFGELYKEVCDDKGKPLDYEKDFTNYHADFLIGTTSKINRYKERLLYEKLFEYFESNLKKAEKLIIIGYGAKDKKINQMLVDHFDHQNKPSFIVDPDAEAPVKELQNKLGATLIETPLEDLGIEEFS